MARRTKSLREFWFHRSETPLDVEYSIAPSAVEVIVVLLAGKFVAGRLTGNTYRLKPLLLEQILDVPVDSGDAQARMKSPRGFQNFVRR